MNRIKTLDTHLTNMIAAGEVVERPSGIIKELVENALDAQATHIHVRVEEGGMTSLEVEDNGIGMNDADLQAAFMRHSTSKIHTQSDLNHIVSFGFRGEALPSIASVSEVVAISSQDHVAHKVVIAHGQQVSFDRAARNQGTTITVRSLFVNTPARLKYIKNLYYENALILETVQKFAMSHTDVAFSYTQDGKLTFQSHGDGNLEHVFHRIHGSKETMLFEGSDFDFKISGVFAHPQFNKSNKYGIWIYLNGRMIRFPKIAQAVSDAFHRHMPSDRHPICVLNIEVDPQLVDVNVHPSKWEVRLSKEKECIQLILTTIENTLDVKPAVQRVIRPVMQEQTSMRDVLIQETPVVYPTQQPFKETITYVEQHVPEPHIESITTQKEVEIQEVTQDVSQIAKIEPLTVLSQMSGKYILAQGDTGLYIIDQHAAMERVRYEHFQRKYLGTALGKQDVLIPHLFEGFGPLVQRIEDLNQFLQEFDLELEVFDDQTLVLRSVPLWLVDTDVYASMLELLENYESGRITDQERFRNLTLATFACHSSVRFNEYLSHDEMVSLVQDLRHCEQPLHCPHGRPTLILMDHDSLIKEFKR